MSVNITGKTHGIVAADWQIKKGKDLNAIVLPLVPAPQYTEGFWHWGGFVWSQQDPFDRYDDLAYQIGDLIYFQEEWSGSVAKSSGYKLWLDWLPANTMPQEAAQHWYTVTGVQVKILGMLNIGDTQDAGMRSQSGAEIIYWSEVKKIWNATHPEYQWDRDRHVVVLEVEAIAE
jgi:hypothetical protein